jgi:hypothetical protein
MIHVLLLVFLAFPQGQDPAPLTAQTILDGHRQGISAQALLAVIDAAAAVATDADLAALQQAGVPAEVIERYKARAAAPVPAATAGPDDGRLKDIVRLVKAGLSEDLVVSQIMNSGESYKPSVNDLLYLKENQVPESVLRALIVTQSRSAASVQAKAQDDSRSFQPLLLMKGFMKKDAPGVLMLRDGRLEWLNAKKPEKNFSLQVSALKTIWLVCSPRPQGNFCYEIGLGTFNKDTFSFRDTQWKTGTNTQVLELYNMIKAHYPFIIFQENIK